MCDADSALRKLADEARSRVDLGDTIRAGLPEPLDRHVEACNLRDDGTLVVLTSSPEWAARLRFEGERMLAHCRRRYPATTRILIRVRT